MKRLIVAITGASGVIYGIRALEILRKIKDIESHVILSPSAARTIAEETDYAIDAVKKLADVIYNHKDIGAAIASAHAAYDAILLDVDNGPDGLSRAANDRLYDLRGLEAARKGLRPGGLLAVWSAAPNKDFVYRLGRAGFAVEEVKARANKGKGVRHIIWVATNPVRSR